MKKNILALIILSTFVLHSQAFAGLSDQEFEAQFCGGDCSADLAMDRDSEGPLSLVEQYVIEKYTEGNIVLDTDIFLRAVSKIPATTITAFRGTSKKSTRIKKVGQIVPIDRITSVSTSQAVAENFIKDQLLVIKTKSAHSISRYSVLGEQESILLPGVKLRVNKISTQKIDLSSEGQTDIVNVQVVELSEI